MRGTALLERLWYGKHSARWLLWPLSWLFICLSAARRLAYQRRWLKSYRAPVPVIVVGNITVGGTGKTPLTVELCRMLREQGWRPAIVSRGYGGKSQDYPLAVKFDSDPSHCGDEPLLLAVRSGCPVYVDPDRPRAVRALLDTEDVNLIVSDDGLQHYALQRDLEIAVVDGRRRHGNGLRLPAGPLREGVQRLQQVDVVMVNEPQSGEAGFVLQAGDIHGLLDDEVKPLHALSQPVHAVAGIGRPLRFFETLRQLGLKVVEHPFADHHDFVASDLAFGDAGDVIMTEKDAVKCRAFAGPNFFYLPVTAALNEQAEQSLLKHIQVLDTADRTNQETKHG